MLKTAAELKAKLATDEPVIGLMAIDQAWPLLVEICRNSGLDYLIVDREHGFFSDELVSHICQVGRLANFPVLVRTVSCESSVVRRMIDMGPCGLLLPCVETTEQLDQVQEAVLMPPRGRRRPGGMGNYWMSNYHYETWKSEFEEHFIVIPQIESQVGVDNAASLAAHPLVTALGLGPYDLSADLGCCWNPENEKFTSGTGPDQSGRRSREQKGMDRHRRCLHFEPAVTRFYGSARPPHSSPVLSRKPFVTSRKPVHPTGNDPTGVALALPVLVTSYFSTMLSGRVVSSFSTEQSPVPRRPFSLERFARQGSTRLGTSASVLNREPRSPRATRLCYDAVRWLVRQRMLLCLIVPCLLQCDSIRQRIEAILLRQCTLLELCLFA